MRIYLTGFMGSGKTYSGRHLAQLLGTPFIDLDEWIEAREGRSVTAIFASDGEAYFRQLEREGLRELSTRLPAFVLATGGGAPCFHDNMRYMAGRGVTVFIDPPLAVLLQRLEAGRAHRPLLNSGTELADVVAGKLAERRACYEAAQIHLRYQDPNAAVARLIYDELSLIDLH